LKQTEISYTLEGKSRANDSMSFRVIPKVKKSRVLKAGTFGCLKGAYAINVTQGCSLRCAYCYARGYSTAPPKGDVLLFHNLPELLREELDSTRRRWLPSIVVFNTATDCFQPHPDILGITHRAMVILLERGIDISFLTKGVIPERFIELFSAYREKVHAQIGVVSLGEGYWRTYEPGAASPAEKLENVERLLTAGVDTEVRVDPIIPFVTDTREELETLFRSLSQRGIRRVSLSYLHVRPAIQKQLQAELPSLHRKLLESCFEGRDWVEVGMSTKTKLLPKKLRENGYERIKATAEAHGISTAICNCKNPDMNGELCPPPRVQRAIARGRIPPGKQLPLFSC
jgi:DNA repair photolyase